MGPRYPTLTTALLGLASADVQSCSAIHPRSSWLGSPGHPSHLRPQAPQLDLTYLRLPWPARGPRLTNRFRRPCPRPMAPSSGSPGPIMGSKSAREMQPDEPRLNRPYRPWAAAAAALRQRASGLGRPFTVPELGHQARPALTAQRSRRCRSRPGPAPPPWEATSLAIECDNYCQQQPWRARCGACVPGRHASSQRTVAFWIGSFRATGWRRIEPSR
jgi:hypothetical protein